MAAPKVEPCLCSVLTVKHAEHLLLTRIRLLLPSLHNLLDHVKQIEDLGEVTEHGHLYQTGIWDQCGNQSKKITWSVRKEEQIQLFAQ